MRSLQTSDVFCMCRLLNQIGMKEEIKAIAMQANNMSDLAKEEVGFEVLFNLLDKATQKKSEKLIYEFLGNILEEDPEAIEKSDPVELIDKIVQVAEPEKWKAFFSRVASLMK